MADGRFFKILAFAWSFAALFHLEYHGLFWKQAPLEHQLSAMFLTAAAVATVWAPTLRHFAVLVVAGLVDVCVLLPDVPNHWLLAGFVNLGWLAGLARSTSPSDVVRRVRAPLMVAVALFYVWTGLWKLNADFIRPDVSCAIASWERVLEIFRWVPDTNASRYVIIVATLAVELVGPLLLLVPATRGAAVVAFVVFHLLLGLDALKIYLNFSSVMFALLLLFLPDAGIARLERVVGERAVRRMRYAGIGYLAFVVVALATGPTSPVFWLGRWVLWLCYASMLLVVVVVAVVGVPRPRSWLPSGARLSFAWIVPALVVFNGVTPILGLKTRTAWQMYSNVRLEPEASNHFLFGRSLDVLGALDDPVRVVTSDSPRLGRMAGTTLTLPWIEFRRRLALDPAATVWERRGERHVTSGADDPALGPPPGIVVRKLLTFRPLGVESSSLCDW
jgi:hypothetical protein